MPPRLDLTPAASISISCYQLLPLAWSANPVAAAPQLEISELEEQKVEAEQRAKQLKEALDKRQSQQGAAAGGWSSDQERR